MNTLLIKKISCIFIFLIPYLLFAQEERRLALVIGNSEYTSGKLPNAVNDANKVSAKLKTLGFDVMLYNNASQKTMGDAINAFTDKASDYAVALFYYAGHGIQSEGNNYLLPVNDGQIEKESDLRYYSEDVNRLLARLEESGCKLKIVVLDACRNNPLCRSWHRSAASQGLAFINAPNGTLIAYATSPGCVAEDGGTAQNSPYTTAFLQTLNKSNLSILEFFNEVGGLVRNFTDGKQTPWLATSPIEGNFIFNKFTVVAGEEMSQQQQLQPQPQSQQFSSVISAANKINGHEYVDLGLSVKWATCNVGASSPSDYGNYYAWGETKTKSDYSEDTYEYYNGEYIDIGSNISGTIYDAARSNWGGNWRMPTEAELDELRNDCAWSWTSVNGIVGYKVTGPNGYSIFLPAAGYRNGTEVYGRGLYGHYWSGTLDEGYSYFACILYFGCNYGHGWSSSSGRDYGHTVRPVTDK